MMVLAMRHQLYDQSITRAGGAGPLNDRATYITPRCSRSWLRGFARTRSYEGKTVQQWLREDGFASIQCARMATADAEVLEYSLGR
jgi:hypothetical protein